MKFIVSGGVTDLNLIKPSEENPNLWQHNNYTL
jgi:hypothetical protein